MQAANLLRRQLSAFAATALTMCLLFPAAVGAEGSGQSLPLWKIDGTRNQVYILGSVHMLRESDHPLPQAFYEAYDDASALIMELDITAIDPVKTQAMVNELGLIQDGNQLSDVLGERDYAEAQVLAERINVPLTMLASAKPWFAAITIDALMLMRIGFSPANGVEMHFSKRAAADGKPISGLETERQQLEMLNALSPRAQRDLLMQTLAEGEDIDGLMDDLILAWRRGDTVKLEGDLLDEIRQYPEIYQAIVVRRNNAWVEQIVELIDAERNYLIIVGAMHLIGDDSVPALLRNKGFRVEQLRQN